MAERNLLKYVSGGKVLALDYEIRGLECPFCKSVFPAQSWLLRIKYCPMCSNSLYRRFFTSKNTEEEK